MKTLLISAIVAAAVSSQLSISRVSPVPPDVAAASAQLTTALAPAARDKIQQLVTLIAPQVDPNTNADALAPLILPLLQAQFPGLTPDSPDVNTLTFLVMSQTAVAQETELTAITTEVAKMAKQKDELRAKIAKADPKLKPTGPLSLSLATAVPPSTLKTPDPLPANASVETMLKRVSDLGDLSQGDTLRFQMLNGRRSKALEIASNALKKMATVNAQTVQNLK